MNIPDGFLEGEIRNSFYVETMMKKTWAAQLKVLSVVDEICKKNNIQYFADWGTLLGAVRHKGYIPCETRSKLGAIQNRLEHTINNLNTTSENTQAAESRIRDTDMASEMVEYSKNNILAQAGQSMLSQANQQTQGVLSLLQ